VLGFWSRWSVFNTGHAHTVGIRVVDDNAVESTNDLLVQERRQGFACESSHALDSPKPELESASNCLCFLQKGKKTEIWGGGISWGEGEGAKC
jgi:hypothetical protein